MLKLKPLKKPFGPCKSSRDHYCPSATPFRRKPKVFSTTDPTACVGKSINGRTLDRLLLTRLSTTGDTVPHV